MVKHWNAPTGLICRPVRYHSASGSLVSFSSALSAGRKDWRPILRANDRDRANRCSSDSGARNGLLPMRNGQSAQLVATHFRTSAEFPHEQSRHLARMALKTGVAMMPARASSSTFNERGSLPISSLPSTGLADGSSSARFNVPPPIYQLF